ncbi:MAG TPA: ATP-binding protein [Ktedonobacteraceae bacterium]|nr:ATP-binding protein [Ktedonobacteraceae bacterium]
MKELQNFDDDAVKRTLRGEAGWRRNYQQELMHYVANSTAALRSCVEIDILLKHIATASSNMPGFRCCSFYLHDRNDFCQVYATPDDQVSYLKQEPLPAFLVNGLMSEEYRLSYSYVVPANAPLCEHVAVKRLFVPIGAENEFSQVPLVQANGMIIVPLSGDTSTLLGLLIFAGPLQGYPPPLEAVLLLEMFANQVAVLLERNHLHEEIRRIGEERVALIEVGRALSSPSALTDQQIVYHTIYEQIKRLMPVDVFFVCRYDPAQDKLVLDYSVENNFVNRSPVPNELPLELSRMLWTDKKHFQFSMQEIKDVLEDEAQEVPEDSRAFWDRPVLADIQTLLFLPIKYADEPAGIICVQSYQMDCYQTEHIRMLEEIGVQAALAIKCALMYTELSSALKQAQESERLENQFLMIASHELRTPLTAVQGYLELLDDFGATLSNEAKARFVSNAHRACEELVLLLGNVMDASRIDQDKVELKPECVHLGEAVDAIAEILEPMITKEQRNLTIHVPDDLYVCADDLRLRQILLNLLGNALKYTPAPTDMAVNAEKLSYAELCQHFSAVRAARTLLPSRQYVVIAVCDWGPGIAPGKQPFLFTKFMRLDSAINSPQRGAGLGLYLCRQLTEAMNGYIWMESTGIPGEGCTFLLALPASE